MNRFQTLIVAAALTTLPSWAGEIVPRSALSDLTPGLGYALDHTLGENLEEGPLTASVYAGVTGTEEISVEANQGAVDPDPHPTFEAKGHSLYISFAVESPFFKRVTLKNPVKNAFFEGHDEFYNTQYRGRNYVSSLRVAGAVYFSIERITTGGDLKAAAVAAANNELLKNFRLSQLDDEAARTAMLSAVNAAVVAAGASLSGAGVGSSSTMGHSWPYLSAAQNQLFFGGSGHAFADLAKAIKDEFAPHYTEALTAKLVTSATQAELPTAEFGTLLDLEMSDEVLQ